MGSFQLFLIRKQDFFWFFSQNFLSLNTRDPVSLYIFQKGNILAAQMWTSPTELLFHHRAQGPLASLDSQVQQVSL